MTQYTIRPNTFIQADGTIQGTSDSGANYAALTNANALTYASDASDTTAIRSPGTNWRWVAFGLSTPSIASDEFVCRVGTWVRWNGGYTGNYLAGTTYRLVDGIPGGAGAIQTDGRSTKTTSEITSTSKAWTIAEMAGLGIYCGLGGGATAGQRPVAWEYGGTVYTLKLATAAPRATTTTTTTQSVIVDATATIDWEASTYDWQLLRKVTVEARIESGGSGQGTGVLKSSATADVYFTATGTLAVTVNFPDPVPNGTYNVYARAIRHREGESSPASDQYGVWSSAATLTVAATPPDTPTTTVSANDTLDKVDVTVAIPRTTLYTGPLVSVQRSDDGGTSWNAVRGAADIAVGTQPAEALLAQAEFWIDAGKSTVVGQTVTNMGSAGSVLNATSGSTGTTDSNDPKVLAWDGINYVYLPGVVGNALSVPNAANLQIIGDIDIRLSIATDDWTPAANQSPMSKFHTASNQKSWYIAIQSDGKLYFSWSADGATDLAATSTAAPTVTDGSMLWVRVTVDVDNGAAGRDIKFWTSSDGVTWAQLGSTVTQAGTTSFYASTTDVYVGGWNSGSQNMFTGKVYRAQVYSGIAGTKVLDVDTSVITSGAATSFTALTSQQVTINRSTSGRKTAAVTQPCLLLGSDDYLEVANRWIDGTTKNVYLPGVSGNYLSTPDANALDVTGDITIDVKVALDAWNNGANQYLISKWTGSTTRSYAFAINNSTNPVLAYSTDGSTQSFATASTSLTTANGATTWLRVTRNATTGDVKFYTSSDGTTFTQLGTTVSGTAGSLYSGSSALEIGSYASGTTALTAGRFYRARIYSDLTQTTKVFDANMETSITSVSQTTFTESSSNAATVTINKSGTGYVATPITQSGYVFPTGAANLTAAAKSLLDFSATDSFTVLGVARRWGTPSSFQVIIGKFITGSAGWNVQYNTIASALWTTMTDGTNSAARNGISTFTDGAVTALGMLVDRTAQTAASFSGSTISATTSTSAVGSVANAQPMRIGANAGLGAPADMEFIAAAVKRGGWTPAEIKTITDYYLGLAGASVTLTDYEAPRGTTVYYRAQQAAYTGGVLNRSAWSVGQPATVLADTWNLKIPVDPDHNMIGVTVIGQPTDAINEDLGVFRPIGRRYPVTVSGTLSGWDGDLTIHCGSVAEWQALQTVIESQTVALLESPFGWRKYVRLLPGSKTRMFGSATQPRREVQVTYVETSAPTGTAPITPAIIITLVDFGVASTTTWDATEIDGGSASATFDTVTDGGSAT